MFNSFAYRVENERYLDSGIEMYKDVGCVGEGNFCIWGIIFRIVWLGCIFGLVISFYFYYVRVIFLISRFFRVYNRVE